MKKRYLYSCPECGNDIDLQTIDSEMDEDQMSTKMYCEKCDASWREHFKIIYDGYSYKGEDFAADGDRIW